MGSLLAPAPEAGEGRESREEGCPSPVAAGKCSAGRGEGGSEEEEWGGDVSDSVFYFPVWELGPLAGCK